METGMNIDFATIITEQCDEIRTLYEMEEHVRQPVKNNLLEFLYDLSAFLLELECPHEELTCGDINVRFQSPSAKTLLSRFLDSEVKAARIVALRRIQSEENACEKVDLELTPVINSALDVVNFQVGNNNEWKLLEVLREKTEGRIAQSQRSPLFTAALDEGILPEIEKQCESFSRDFYRRLLLLNSRLKVTVESFLWNDRLKPHRENIQTILHSRVEEIGKVKANCDVTHLLSASSSLLYIQKASANDRRYQTRSKQHPLFFAGAPKDRGGRTEEMIGVKEETFAQQKRNYNRSNYSHGMVNTSEPPKTREEQEREQHISRNNEGQNRNKRGRRRDGK